jgi:hypothetical protein
MKSSLMCKVGILGALLLSACTSNEEGSDGPPPTPLVEGAGQGVRDAEGGNGAPDVPATPAVPAVEPFDLAKAACDPRGTWQLTVSELQGYPDCSKLIGWLGGLGTFTIAQDERGQLVLPSGNVLSVSRDGCTIGDGASQSQSVPNGYLSFNYSLSFKLAPGGSTSIEGSVGYSVIGEGYGSCSGALSAERADAAAPSP